MPTTARRLVLTSRLVFAAAFCLLPFAAGCGGDDSSSDDQSTAAAAPPAGGAAATGQPPALNAGGGDQGQTQAQGNANANAGSSGSDPRMAMGQGGQGGYPGAGYGGEGGEGMEEGYGEGEEGYPGGYGGEDMAGGYPGGGYPGMNPGGGFGQGQPQKPARPEAFADWATEHFEDAVRQRDEKVLAAIDDRVAAKPGSAEVAVLLTRLLNVSAEAPAQQGGGYGGYGGGSPYGADGLGEGDYGEDREGYPGGGGYPPGGGGYPSGAYPGAGAGGAPGQPTLSSGAGGGGGGTSEPPQSRVSPFDDRSPHKTSQQMFVTDHSVTPALDGAAALILPAAITWVQQPPQLIGAGGSGSSQSGSAPDPSRGGYPGANYPGADNPGGYPGGGYPGGFGGAAAQRGNLQDRDLVETIVTGLLTNGSQEAWQTIHGLLTGQVTSPLETDATCEIVVSQLFQNYNGAAGPIQQTLIAIIDGSAPLPPENRSASIRTVAAVSALAVDTLTGMQSQQPQSQQRQQPGNGMFGYGGYDGGAGDMGSASGIGGGEYGGEYGGYPGGSPGAAGFGGEAGAGGGADLKAELELPRVELDGDHIGFAAALLWGPQVKNIVVQQLQNASSLDAAVDALTLSASMPMSDIRHAEFSLFSRVHATGANPLINSGVLNGATSDPALLLALKALPRQRPSRSGAPEPLDSWTLATQQLVYALRDELRDSAASLPAFPGAFPVRLHRNAVPEVSVMITLPGPAKDFLGSAAPAETRVYYTRTTFTPTNPREQNSVAEHYESRATGFLRPDPANGILWVDGVKTLTGGERRAMDVVIQKAETPGAQGGFGGGFGAGGLAGGGGEGAGLSGYGGGGAGGTYTIEVIVVEAVDPKTPPGEATLSSTDGD